MHWLLLLVHWLLLLSFQSQLNDALETRRSHTIKHRATEIVPKRHKEGHKASAILGSPTTRRRERGVLQRGGANEESYNEEAQFAKNKLVLTEDCHGLAME